MIIINKWFFPVIAAGMLGAFYTNDPTSISPVGLILATILSFIGVAVTERLDKIISKEGNLSVSFDGVIDSNLKPINEHVANLEKALKQKELKL